jgi:hypothetical protein
MERATIDRDTFVRPNARPTAGVRATLIAGTVTLAHGLAYAATVSVGRRVTFYGRNGFRPVEAIEQIRHDVEDTRAWAATRTLSDGARNRRALLSLAAQ